MKMNTKKLISLFGCIVFLNITSLPNCTQLVKTPCKQITSSIDCNKSEQRIPNLGLVRKQIYAYFESGMHEKEVRCITSHIKQYLDSFNNPVQKKYALVFDIDDTLLSTWLYNKETNCGYDKERFLKWEHSAQLPAIKPMRDLYNFAQQKGFSLFLITGRKSELKNATIKNLRQQGFYSWKQIFFRPSTAMHSRIPFKANTRKAIEEQGYTILATIGDQLSDLKGGYARRTFKVPNPMYYIP